MLELDLEDEAATATVARSLAAVLEAGDVVGLEGGLGAGKTTFTREAVYGLGVGEETAVTSPTFALLHQYEGRLPIGHADLYRLADELELEELGLDELVHDGAVLFVEWGRKFPVIAGRVVLWVELEIVSDLARRARLHPQGTRGDAIIGAVRTRLRS
ncbi:MAG: tRNA (adenosine(37)-N6)-threonylcarbamoyltransferase complex ATPase subunit type 1 TsaE [Polyangiales bacterium]